MENQKEEKQKSTADNDEGDEPTTDEEVKRLNIDTERINKAIAENENAKARQKLGGISEAGSPSVKKPEETDEEYTARFQKGEVNPLEDDGVI